ncbi:hypothetical protein [Serratia sp. JUb9]|uniref:hypothetical protein n=1 Tax=Serratia sp. JUb9 TaxID=2724469 RepID=UPI002101F57E|nr:hypothetical protein [Serratia sp. JUb9]
MKKLAQQVVKVTDESFKNKAFNTQPVAEFIKGESTAGGGLSTKTVDYLRDIQKTNTDQLVKVFDPKQAESKLNMFGKQFEQILGEGGSNKQGNTKVFATEGLSKQEIFDYVQSLAGSNPLLEVKNGMIWTAVLNERTGEKVTLRSVSSSKEETKARWTVDIIGNEQLKALQGKVKKRMGIKFR